MMDDYRQINYKSYYRLSSDGSHVVAWPGVEARSAKILYDVYLIYLLEVGEVYGLDLNQAGLVVLSTCQTQLGS